jgi:hypothetical protein
MRMRKRGSVVLGAGAAALATLALAGTANAGLEGDSTYAAMAFEKKSGALGSVWLQDSLADAKDKAIRECKDIATRPNKCRIVAKVQDGCMAAANNGDPENFEYGFGTGKDVRKAKKAAKKAVPGGDGKVVQVVCSDTGPR